MRHGFRSSVIMADGKFVGFNLGSDFCSEHEWGIEKLKESFGMVDGKKAIGLERRIIHDNPDWLVRIENQGELYLICSPNISRDNEARWIDCFKSELRPENDSGIGTAWSEDDFAIRAVKEEHKKFLVQLHEAFAVNDVAIFFGGGFFIENPGLCICIASALPEEVKERWAAADREKISIDKEAAATGIKERLRKAGKKWFYLGPKKLNGVLKFWLNPMEQDQNNAGHFTVAELDQWIKGKGPIPRKGPR